MKKKNKILLCALLSAFLLFLAGPGVFAQAVNGPADADKTEAAGDNIPGTAGAVSGGADEVIPGFSEDDDMKPLKALTQPYTISYGGWLTSVFMNDSASETAASTSIAKAWFRSALPYNIDFYLRLTDVFSYYVKSPAEEDYDNAFDLDIAALSITNNSRVLKFSLGRKYFVLGSGLVFGNRGDGAEFLVYSKFADIKLFGVYTGFLNEDTNTSRLFSAAGFDEGKKIFVGASLSKTVRNQTMYMMGLSQKDQVYETGGIKTRYDSQHYGAGLKGVAGNAFYFGELVLEQGQYFASPYDEFGMPQAQTESDVFAAAALLGVNYYFDASVKPALLFNYAFGTGDPDKQDAMSATGNLSGQDTGFMYFGSYTGGYALRPYLSNMHVFRLGFSIVPLYNSSKKYLKRISLVVNYTNYLKHRTDGVINNGETKGTGRIIGHGIDTALRWQVFSDFSIFGNFGLFIPGSAYEEGAESTDARSFVVAGLNLSF